ncbi:hypothetical protein HPB48_010333 [Haemaphysalis longicornis]|uniref:Uncharacterized protein n=1 Tax=Haemaphysalis longicornis TaxID=44386 RepID=A0A9J6H6D8_HAELO|nr:hypothetical protein HPB48_010333 [Haemaphysalis longicornis]
MRQRPLPERSHTPQDIGNAPSDYSCCRTQLLDTEKSETYLRNRTAEEWLNGLALMSIHRMQVSVDEVIAVFMEKPRRLKIAA